MNVEIMPAICFFGKKKMLVVGEERMFFSSKAQFC